MVQEYQMPKKGATDVSQHFANAQGGVFHSLGDYEPAGGSVAYIQNDYNVDFYPRMQGKSQEDENEEPRGSL